MSPYRHGEVCVTGDGAETDLDLGYYERLIDENLNQFSGLTTEQMNRGSALCRIFPEHLCEQGYWFHARSKR